MYIVLTLVYAVCMYMTLYMRVYFVYESGIVESLPGDHFFERSVSRSICGKWLFD